MEKKKRVARIKVTDIPRDLKVSEKEMRAVKGGSDIYALDLGGRIVGTMGGTKGMTDTTSLVIGGVGSRGMYSK